MERKRRVSVLLILCTVLVSSTLLAFAGCQTMSGVLPSGSALPDQYEGSTE